MTSNKETQACIELLNQHGFHAAVPIFFHYWGGLAGERCSEQVRLFANAHPSVEPDYVSNIDSEIDNLKTQLRKGSKLEIKGDKIVDIFNTRSYFSMLESQASRLLKSADKPIQWALWWLTQQFLNDQDKGGNIQYFIQEEARTSVHRKTVSLNLEIAFDNHPEEKDLKNRLAEIGIIWSRHDSNAYPNTPRYRITGPVAHAVLDFFKPRKIPAVAKSESVEYRNRIQELTFSKRENSSFWWKQQEPESLPEDLGKFISQGAVMRQYSPRRKNTGDRSRKPSKIELAVPYQIQNALTKEAYHHEATCSSTQK